MPIVDAIHYLGYQVMEKEGEDPPEDGCGDNCTAVFWIKIAFIVVCFLEGMIGGLVPTWVEGCKSNPAVFGIANAFAAGVFLAIALLHMLPEEIDDWKKYRGKDEVFPLPELLAFAGYSIILIFDKVAFDSHAMFEEDGHGHAHDPANTKLERNMRRSLEDANNLPEDATEQ